MTLKQRLEKLEQAAPHDDGSKVCWRSILRRTPEGLDEAVHSACILGAATAPNEKMERQPGESADNFIRHVLQRAAIIHSRPDPEFAEASRWTPDAGTTSTS